MTTVTRIGSTAPATSAAIRAFESGRMDVAGRMVEAILAQRPDDVDARILCAVIAEMNGDYRAAAEKILEVLRVRPSDPSRHNSYGFTYAYLATALERNLNRCLDKATPDEISRGYQDVPWLLGIAHQVAGNLSEAKRCYESVIRSPIPSHSARALLSIVHQQMGEWDAFRAEFDFDNDVRVIDLDVEKPIGNLEALNAVLLKHVRVHPSFRPERHVESPYAKSITDDLNVQPAEPVRVLDGIIRGYVDRLIASLPRDPGHPFRGTVPERYRLFIFGALLEPGGFHSPHIHTQGWLSGGYYAKVPDFHAPGIDSHAGNLEFGRLPYDHATGFEPATRDIRPRRGQLIMWPSYYFHSTVPCPVGGLRLTMGFDVVPLV